MTTLTEMVTVEIEVEIQATDSPIYGRYVNEAQCQTKVPQAVKDWAEAEAALKFMRESLKKGK